MLVMRRRAGEGFLVGDDIEIEILEVGPTRVKLGIVAPPECSILRKEVILTREQNVTAAQSADPAAVSWLTRRLGPASGQAVNSLTAREPRSGT
jgi:carbon storage regulator